MQGGGEEGKSKTKRDANTASAVLGAPSKDYRYFWPEGQILILRIRQILLFHTICPTQGTHLVLGACAHPRFEGKSHQMSVYCFLIRDEELPDTKGLAQSGSQRKPVVTRDAEFRSPSSHPNTPLGQPSFFNLTTPNFKRGHKQTGKNKHVMVLTQPPESAAVGTGCVLCTGLSQAVKLH